MPRAIYAFTHDGIVRAKTVLPPREQAIEVSSFHSTHLFLRPPQREVKEKTLREKEDQRNFT